MVYVFFLNASSSNTTIPRRHYPKCIYPNLFSRHLNSLLTGVFWIACDQGDFLICYVNFPKVVLPNKSQDCCKLGNRHSGNRRGPLVVAASQVLRTILFGIKEVRETSTFSSLLHTLIENLKARLKRGGKCTQRMKRRNNFSFAFKATHVQLNQFDLISI